MYRRRTQIRTGQVLFVAVLFLNSICNAQDPLPAQVVLAESGRIPVLITAPHGGTVDLPSIPTRREIPNHRVTLLRDGETNKLAVATARAVERLTGKKPYLVVAQFSREDLDANRPADLAYQAAAAKPYYDLYHKTIDQFSRQIMQEWNQGLLLDLHAQWLMTDTIMRGTRDGRTCPRLINRFGWPGILGPGSVLGRLQRQGYTLFPPAQSQTEGDWTHLGSFTVANYSRLGIDAIQLEIGIDLCGDVQSVTSLANHLALGIADHLDRLSVPAPAAAPSQTRP